MCTKKKKMKKKRKEKKGTNTAKLHIEKTSNNKNDNTSSRSSSNNRIKYNNTKDIRDFSHRHAYTAKHTEANTRTQPRTLSSNNKLYEKSI